MLRFSEPFKEGAICVLFVLAMVGFYNVGFSKTLTDILFTVSSMGFSRTTGHMQIVDWKQNMFGKNGFDPVATFVFSVNGVEYTGTKIGRSTQFGYDGFQQSEIERSLEPWSNVPVAYHPDNPAINYVVVHRRYESLVGCCIIFFSFFVIAPSVCTVVAYRRFRVAWKERGEYKNRRVRTR